MDKEGLKMHSPVRLSCSAFLRTLKRCAGSLRFFTLRKERERESVNGRMKEEEGESVS